MATSFHCFPIISAAASSSSSSSHDDRTKAQKLPLPNSNWFTPLFGWASNPDYIQQASTSCSGAPKFQPGCFTEEKAKELRKMTVETSTFHDIMYHSAIASRLASDVSGRQNQNHR
ncbi:PREDICTED: uncharacterized protein LOC109152699 [Ipomoea nil]|uniref:uncharacterized protein LOC109152699 n=1 Tax=Ipomoea nil TaxID=35883 RepID=UPI0009013835|nr:PREDICTED: uncharacterized protein LOC109152699 [Ipomoea nil]